MILFHSKFEKLRAFSREKMGSSPSALEDENLADKLEKNDTLALILSAMITIIPVVLVFLCLVAAAGYFFIVR